MGWEWDGLIDADPGGVERVASHLLTSLQCTSVVTVTSHIIVESYKQKVAKFTYFTLCMLSSITSNALMKNFVQYLIS